MDKISSLENRLFDAIPNNLAKLEKVKNDAKRELKSNDLSYPQRTHVLNIILLVNEMIAASRSESESNGDLKAFYQAARVSAGKASEVSDDTDALSEEFRESVAAVRDLGAFINNNKALELIDDIEIYGTMSLSLTSQLTIDMEKLLEKIHPNIPMLHTTGDGNCFYNAISTEDYILANQPSLVAIKADKHEDRQGELRNLTLQQMRQSHAKDNELDYHSKDGAWATDEQIRKLVAAEDKPILVLAHDPVSKNKIYGTLYVKHDGASADSNNLRIIVNIDNRHFNALYTTRDDREELIAHYKGQIVPVS